MRRFDSDEGGAALAEMALLLPLLLLIGFGGIEFARLFQAQHLITKGVQDAARFAARDPNLLSGTTCSTSAGNAGMVKDVATKGRAASSLLMTEFTTDTVTVSIRCDGTVGLNSPVSGGLPIVTVSAAVPMNEMFGVAGLGQLTLRATHSEIGVGL